MTMQLKILSSILNLSAVLVTSAFSSQAFAECAALANKGDAVLPTSTMIYSPAQHDWDYMEQESTKNEVVIAGCDGSGSLQLAVAPISFNPADYRPQMYNSYQMDMFPQSCSIQSDVPHLIGEKDHYNDYLNIAKIANSCFATQVIAKQNAPIVPVPNANCKFEFLNPAKTAVRIKGENCQIQNPTGSYSIKPMLDSGCDTATMGASGLANIDAQLQIIHTGRQNEFLTARPVQIILNADSSQTMQVKPVISQNSKFQVQRVSDYSVDFDFASLRLQPRGNGKYLASSKYYLKNKVQCSGAQCINAASYRVPAVIRSEVYLAKLSSPADRQYMGRWYNASIAPPQWEGIETSPVTNAIIYNWESVELNRVTDDAEVGDYVVLSSTLINPNQAIQLYYTEGDSYFNQIGEALRPPTVAVNGTASAGLESFASRFASFKIHDIGFQSSIHAIGFNEIVSTEDVKANIHSDQWIVNFGRYCSPLNPNICMDLGDLGHPILIETEFKITQVKPFLTLTPVRTIKSSEIPGLAYDVKLNQNTEVHCLNNKKIAMPQLEVGR